MTLGIKKEMEPNAAEQKLAADWPAAALAWASAIDEAARGPLASGASSSMWTMRHSTLALAALCAAEPRFGAELLLTNEWMGMASLENAMRMSTGDSDGKQVLGKWLRSLPGFGSIGSNQVVIEENYGYAAMGIPDMAAAGAAQIRAASSEGLQTLAQAALEKKFLDCHAEAKEALASAAIAWIERRQIEISLDGALMPSNPDGARPCL